MRTLPYHRSWLVPHNRDSGEIPPPSHHMGHKEKPATWRGAFTQTGWHPSVRLPASRLWEIHFCYWEATQPMAFCFCKWMNWSLLKTKVLFFLLLMHIEIPSKLPHIATSMPRIRRLPMPSVAGTGEQGSEAVGCTYVQPLWKTICHFFLSFF